jgi:hypothetical protein
MLIIRQRGGHCLLFPIHNSQNYSVYSHNAFIGHQVGDSVKLIKSGTLTIACLSQSHFTFLCWGILVNLAIFGILIGIAVL